jgi:hypothetical protein
MWIFLFGFVEWPDSPEERVGVGREQGSSSELEERGSKPESA